MPCAEGAKLSGEIPCPAPRRWSRTRTPDVGAAFFPRALVEKGQRGTSQENLTSTPSRDTKVTVTQTGGRLETIP